MYEQTSMIGPQTAEAPAPAARAPGGAPAGPFSRACAPHKLFC